LKKKNDEIDMGSSDFKFEFKNQILEVLWKEKEFEYLLKMFLFHYVFIKKGKDLVTFNCSDGEWYGEEWKYK
jgi:hypothetical protein